MTTTERTQIPAPTEPRPFHFPSFERFHLNNGLQILFARDKHFPLVNVTLCVHSSALMDAPGKEGVAHLTSELLTEGTANRTSVQIANELEFMGVHYGSHSDWNALYLEMNTLARYLEPAFDVFSDMALHPSFPEEELERVRKELMVERLRVADNPSRLASEKFSNLLYGMFRYGRPIEGTYESLQKITRQDVAAFYEQHVLPGNSTLIVVGDVTRKKVENLAEAFFGSWPPAEISTMGEMEFKQPLKTRVAVVHKPDSAQAELRMGHLGIARNNPDYYAVTVMNEILGGYFLSRINMNLREEHGYTYGAHSIFSYRKGLGPFFITAAIHSENVADAVQEVLKEVRYLRSEKVEREELENAKGQLIGVFPIAFETADQIAMGLANIVISRLPDDYYHKFRERIAAVTAEDVLRVAQKYLLPDKMLIVVTGDREQLSAQLRPLFDVTVFDQNGNLLSE